MEFPRFPGNGNGLTTKGWKAKKITYNGIDYFSITEARFAEYLTCQGIKFEHEPPRWNGSYTPDFYLPKFSLFVEVKPKKYLHEVGVFKEEIDKSKQSWICEDRLSREWHGWHLIDCSLQFCLSWVVNADGDPRIEFYGLDCIVPQLKIYDYDFPGPIIIEGEADVFG
jgi:hypothetical protein